MPSVPYRGIQPFRYVDHAIFFAREEEARRLASLVAVYRGALLYGDSGTGKSSLINAGLLPGISRLGFAAERVRVQPHAGEELVIERIATDDDDSGCLPSALVSENDTSARVVLSTETFEQRVGTACESHRPLLIFDQFEELLTLFDDPAAEAAQRRIVDLLVKLLREELPVKLLFAFREDYLGRVKQLLGACPELVDQALRLGPPAPDALQTIIRGPFERYPGHFAHELDPLLAERLGAALAQRFGTGDLSLSEVQTVCLRLWRADEPQALLTKRGVQGLLEDYLGEALDAFPRDVRGAAVALLAQMVTSHGTRNVISAEDLVQRVRAEEDIPRPLLQGALDRLERESRLVRRERRRDIYLYEITSEFLVPWISRRREELRRHQERAHERRRLRIVGSIAGALLVVAAVVAVLAVWALDQRSEAHHQAANAESLALTSAAQSSLATRPDVSLLFALEAYREAPYAEARGLLIAARRAIRSSGVLGILHGHTDAVLKVAFSPDGRTLASASGDGTVRLWDTRTRRQLGSSLGGHQGIVHSVAFSPDGRTLASAGNDKTVRLWDARTHKQLGRPLLGHAGFNSVAFSRDGRTVAAGGAGRDVRLWDTRTHKPLGAWPVGSTISSVAFSPDGRTLASADAARTILLWDTHTHKLRGALRGHTDVVNSVAFSPDGRTLASAGNDRTIRLWDVRSHKPLGRPLLGHTDWVMDVAFSPDGRTLASAGDDKTVRRWDTRTHKQLGAALRGHTLFVNGVAFSPDGRMLASASDDSTVRLWATRDRRRPGPALRGHNGNVESVAFSRDGRMLASAGYDRTIRLWDTRTHRPLGSPLRGADDFISVAFGPGGMLASGNYDGTIRLWNARGHTPLGSALDGHAAVESVAFSPDGQTLASAGDDKAIRLWDTRTHRQLGAPLTGHTQPVESVAFSPDGRSLASASDDSTVRLWDTRTHRQLGAPLRGHTFFVNSVAFSPDGRTLASASGDKTIRLWNPHTHRQLGAPLRGHGDTVFGIAFSPDGRTLASASADKTIRLWDTLTHKQLGPPLRGHSDVVNSVAFSPDGRTLASASGDWTVRLWDDILWGNDRELRAEVCDLVGSGLSRAEWDLYAVGVPYRRECS